MEHTKEPWRPDVCPITGRKFFLWIYHWSSGDLVPTYGGPYDSYTIPVKDDYGDYVCERYDHDRGGWLVDDYEDVGVKIIDGQLYTSEFDPEEINQQRDELLAAAERYAMHYLQDEAAERELCYNDEQHDAAKALFAAIAKAKEGAR